MKSLLAAVVLCVFAIGFFCLGVYAQKSAFDKAIASQRKDTEEYKKAWESLSEREREWSHAWIEQRQPKLPLRYTPNAGWDAAQAETK